MRPYNEMSAGEFDDKYQTRPVWDIGRPQKAFRDIFAHSSPASPVLDIGCGSGDLSMFVAGLGCEVLGIDFAPAAIEQARSKAQATGSPAVFEVRDILAEPAMRQEFQTVLDCCFFHVLDDHSREKYERRLRRLVRPDGQVFMLCFAGGQIGLGPRPVLRADLERTFAAEWRLERIESSIMEVSFIPAGSGMPGTFAVIRRNGT